ncbi:cytochrome P450 [Zopfochytrium polystomum]|nr:cytochrome P450 [Zopfochytrium polystomum]
MSRPQRQSILRGAAAVAAAVAASYWLFQSLKLTVLPTEWTFKKRIKRFPGSLPILGNTLAIIASIDRLHDKLSEVCDASDDEPVVTTILSLSPAVIINDPVSMEHVFKNHFEKYEKGPFFRGNFHDLLGDGIFNSDGEQWKHQRKLAANIFNVKNFREFVENAFAEEMQDLIVILDAAADSGKMVNLNDLFFRFTMDGFCKVAFGAEIGCMKSGEPPVFAASFDRAQSSLFKRFIIPFSRLLEPITVEGRQLQRDLQVIRDFSLRIVDERLQQQAAGSGTPPRQDLLAFLMKSTDPDGRPIARDDLASKLVNFLFAGRDTTALTLTWIFLMLHRQPHVRARLVDEIDNATAALSPDESVPYDTIRSAAALPYTTAVIHETLRLHPPVPYNVKQAVADDVLPNGVHVPKGTLLAWGPYALGRSTRIWGADAAAFRPERWLDAPGPSPYAYNAFNAGPRLCLGKRFAEVEVAFVLVELLRRFSFAVRDVGGGGGGKSKSYAVSATLALEDGELLSRVSRR